jgi:hypothetical protein
LPHLLPHPFGGFGEIGVFGENRSDGSEPH